MKKSLAQFIQQKREDIGLTPKGLSDVCGVDLYEIEDIEAGKELFLSVTTRQNLAKVLRCSPAEIQSFEKIFKYDEVSFEVIESLKELILNGAGGLKCPKCGEILITKIEKMYDLEDNPVFHPKAHCSKCVFHF